MVAALFALHPINVESVAWISERKNLLSMLFFLLALGAYRWYVRAPRTSRYVVVALFALGLMAKSQVITLPFVLLLWDYWPLRRISARAVADDRPRQEPATAFSPTEYLRAGGGEVSTSSAVRRQRFCHHAQQTAGAMHTGRIRFRPSGLGNAVVCYARYLGKAFWPSHLALIYPHPGASLRTWKVFAALILLLAVTASGVERQRRYLPVGWFWFLGTMVPMIGLVQVGRAGHGRSLCLSAFHRLVHHGVLGSDGLGRAKKGLCAWLAGASVVVLVALSVVAYRQLGYWSDNVVLWTHIIDVTPPNYIAQDDLGGALLNEGRGAEAMQRFHAAAEIYPLDPFSNLNLAIYAQRHNDPQQAITRAKIVLEWPAPRMRIKAYTDHGACLSRRRRLREIAGMLRGISAGAPVIGASWA